MSGLVDARGAPLRTCGRVGCNRRAEVYVEIAIPPRNYPMERALKMSIGLTLCRRHGHEENAENFMTDDFRQMCAGMVLPSPVALDFERAIVRLRPIGDESFKAFEAAAKEGRAGRARRTLH